MSKDKKVTPPKPKTKNLTKSQKKLLNKDRTEVETLTREIFNYIAERINRLGAQIIENRLENFAEELELDIEKWQFDARKTQFKERDN